MAKLSVDEVVRRLAERKPKNECEVMDDCGLSLKFIGDGAYRRAYHVLGTQAVIKIPKKPLEVEEKWDENGKWSSKVKSSEDIRHANLEFKTLEKMKKSKRKYVPLHPHLPEFYHFNQATGVSLVKKYRKCPSTKGISTLRQKVADIFGIGIWDTDLGYNNFGVEKGVLKVIDLGCIEDF